MTRFIGHDRALMELLAEQDDTLPTAARNDEPMRRPDYRAKKHAKPQPWLRYAAREAVEMAVVLAFVVAVCGAGLATTI